MDQVMSRPPHHGSSLLSSPERLLKIDAPTMASAAATWPAGSGSLLRVGVRVPDLTGRGPSSTAERPSPGAA